MKLRRNPAPLLGGDGPAPPGDDPEGNLYLVRQRETHLQLYVVVADDEAQATAGHGRIVGTVASTWSEVAYEVVALETVSEL